MNLNLMHHRDFAIQRRTSFSRRHFLRGLGACLALPAFESLAPSELLASPETAAAPTGSSAPVRMAVIYVPNGAIPSAWWPAGDGGNDFSLSPTLQPLEKIRHQLQVISGLADASADPGADGGGDHPRAGGSFLTGVRIKKTEGSDICAGISIDQVLARRLGHLTSLPSLELTCDIEPQANECDAGYSSTYVHNLSWCSPTQPLTPESNPRLVFERLFGTGSTAERLDNLKRRQEEQRSILDFVLADTREVERKLNGRDRQKLDQFLTSVREVEQRIERAECTPAANPTVNAPSAVPHNFAEHIPLMLNILALAFQTDSTRIATLMLAREESNRPFPQLGLSEGHHRLSHHRNEQKMVNQVKEIDKWYVSQFASFVEKLEQMKDLDGRSLLHNSMILYGSGHSDGNRHSHYNLPILLAGAGGGTLKPGRYLKVKPTPITNLFLSLADRMGARGIERHGDSTGRLEVIG